MAMNLIVLTGRLVADPEMKYTQSGKAYAKFGLAVSRNYNREETDFINIVAWEKRAELISQYLKKGSMVGITGALRTRTYEDEENKKRKVVEVIAEGIEFLDSRKGDSESSLSSDSSGGSQAAPNNDDEFPF